MKKLKLNIITKGYLPLFFLIALFSCKKESTEIGLDLIGDESLANAINIEYSNIICRTVSDDTFSVNTLTSSLLGIINDPVFGESKASLVVQPLLKETGINLNNTTLDSIKLVLTYDLTQVVSTPTEYVAYDIHYGDLTSEIILDVFKLDESLNNDIYYNDYTPILGNQVGTFVGKFNLDSVKSIIDGESIMLSPRISITLDHSFGQEILDFDEAAFNTNDNFIASLQGLVIVPREVVIGDGAIIAVEANNGSSSLNLFYDDTLSLEIPLGISSKRINFFETSHSAEIEEQKNSTGHYDLTYLQSLGGSKVKIDIPDLVELIEFPEEVVINEAKLVIPIAEQYLDSVKYPQPPRLWLLTPDETDTTQSLTQFKDTRDPRFSEAYYDKNVDGYVFYFNRYLQYLIKEYQASGINKFKGFYLSIPVDFPITPHRAVINSNTQNGSMQLSVKYTKLN